MTLWLATLISTLPVSSFLFGSREEEGGNSTAEEVWRRGKSWAGALIPLFSTLSDLFRLAFESSAGEAVMGVGPLYLVGWMGIRPTLLSQLYKVSF